MAAAVMSSCSGVTGLRSSRHAGPRSDGACVDPVAWGTAGTACARVLAGPVCGAEVPSPSAEVGNSRTMRRAARGDCVSGVEVRTRSRGPGVSGDGLLVTRPAPLIGAEVSVSGPPSWSAPPIGAKASVPRLPAWPAPLIEAEASVSRVPSWAVSPMGAEVFAPRLPPATASRVAEARRSAPRRVDSSDAAPGATPPGARSSCEPDSPCRDEACSDAAGSRTPSCFATPSIARNAGRERNAVSSLLENDVRITRPPPG